MVGTSYLTQPRKPKGTPVGGEWTAMELDAAQVSLLETNRRRSAVLNDPAVQELIAKKRAMLEAEGLAPANAVMSLVNPGTAVRLSDRDRKRIWDTAAATAEYRTSGTGVAQLSEGRTSGYAGRSKDGVYRTAMYRRRVANVDLRMPSRAEINRQMAANETSTIDIPVLAAVNGNSPVQVQVRVTRNGRGRYSAQALGVGGKTEIMVGESVAAALEGRSAQLAINSYDDFVTRRAHRELAGGVEGVAVASGWIDKVAYDEKTGTMYSRMKSGRTYGHQVPRVVYDNLVGAASPGTVYNRLVKGNERSEGVHHCEDCGRFTAAGAEHQCMKKVEETSSLASNKVAAAYVGLAPVAAAPQPALAQPSAAPAEHVRVENEESVDLAKVWREQMNGARRWEGAGLYGPRGWSGRAASLLSPNASSTYVPFMYHESFSGERWVNDGDLVRLDGIQAHQAEQLLGEMPAENLSDRQGYSPTARALLEAATNSPGTVELHGYLVGPSRKDERVRVEGLHVYDDDLVEKLEEILEEAPSFPDPDDYETDDQAQEAYEEAATEHRHRLESLYSHVATKFGLDAESGPDEVHVVENPWRPGEKAVRLWWD